jgi:orotidine-5'-phosphate decarboxylase
VTGEGAAVRGTYLGRLHARIRLTGSVLCVGIDPDPYALPDGFARDARGIGAFARMVLEAAAPSAAAIKVNVAFLERWGSAGVRELEALRALVPADLPFIADAKRGDIGSTAAQYASALFDALDADAVTVSPYLGGEAIRPLLERPDRFAYVLCRTSNPGAGELQELMVEEDLQTGAPAESLAHRVARRVATWAVHPGTVGLVVGATAPAELAAVRAIVPGLPFLVPGVGAQGGDLEGALAHGTATAAPGGHVAGGALLVNVSRGIASAAIGAVDPRTAVATAAADWATRLRVLG